MPRNVVKSDDQDARVLAADNHDEIVQSREVGMVTRQHRAILSDRPGQHSSIAD